MRYTEKRKEIFYFEGLVLGDEGFVEAALDGSCCETMCKIDAEKMERYSSTAGRKSRAIWTIKASNCTKQEAISSIQIEFLTGVAYAPSSIRCCCLIRTSHGNGAGRLLVLAPEVLIAVH